MVNRLLLVLCLLMHSNPGNAAALAVKLGNTRVEMGKYLSVSIVYVGEQAPGSANLQQWQEDFVVDRRDSNVENLLSGQIQTTEHLRLYPRAIGDRTLGAIALGGAIARPTKISVKPAVRNGIDGTPRWRPVPTQIWQGQTIEIGIELAMLHPSNHIAVEQAVFDGFEFKALPREKLGDGDTERMLLRWRLIAQRPGSFRLDPPAIEQRGRGRWRYYLPRAEIEVKPLPSYLPPTVPVGRLSLRTGLEKSHNAKEWWVELENQGVLTEEAHGLRTRLATLGKVPVESVSVITTAPPVVTPFLARQRYQIRVPDWSWGVGDGPEVSVRYFDADAGRMKTISRQLPATWQVPDTVHYLLLLMLVGGLSAILYKLAGSIRRLLAWQRYRSSLLQAEDAHKLRHILLEPGGFRCMVEWAAEKRSKRARQLATQLNSLCFSRSDKVSLAEIKYSLAKLHSFPKRLN